MYASNTIRNCSSLEQVITVINGGAIVEGMEGVEFTPAQMAGQYAFEAARESGWPVDESALDAHLDFLAEAGAEFDRSGAIVHGLQLAAAANGDD